MAVFEGLSHLATSCQRLVLSDFCGICKDAQLSYQDDRGPGCASYPGNAHVFFHFTVLHGTKAVTLTSLGHAQRLSMT